KRPLSCAKASTAARVVATLGWSFSAPASSISTHRCLGPRKLRRKPEYLPLTKQLPDDKKHLLQIIFVQRRTSFLFLEITTLLCFF
ncbi:MAG: hypothetical protein EBY22_13945, partial [Gammaproteobacteria bacterium]|nr:hypothetical protein [Gammaproteobacteria bacterium]